MIWTKDSTGREKSEGYTIIRTAHYYYDLMHETDGAIRMYRTLEGAHRAAERHKKKGGYQPKKKASSKKIEASFKFQEPQRPDESDDENKALDGKRDHHANNVVAKRRS